MIKETQHLAGKSRRSITVSVVVGLSMHLKQFSFRYSRPTPLKDALS